MARIYHEVAGKSLERLSACSDGVFSVALTLLVLDLHVPVREAIHNEHDLWRAIVVLSPRLVPYLMTFMTVGIFWVGQQAQLNFFERSNRDLAWIHIAFLLVITLTPFSTALLAEFITYRLAVIIYWLNILAAGVTLYWSWKYAVRAHLVKESVPADLRAAVERRIVVAQALYAMGVLLCAINTFWSIGFIVLVQLNYVLAPRIRVLYRI